MPSWVQYRFKSNIFFFVSNNAMSRMIEICSCREIITHICYSSGDRTHRCWRVSQTVTNGAHDRSIITSRIRARPKENTHRRHDAFSLAGWLAGGQSGRLAGWLVLQLERFFEPDFRGGLTCGSHYKHLVASAL